MVMHLYKKKIWWNLQEVELYCDIPLLWYKITLIFEDCGHTAYPMHQYISMYWIFIQCMHEAFQSSAEAVLQFWQVVSPYLPFTRLALTRSTHSSGVEARVSLEMLVLLHESIMIMWLIESLCVLSQNGDVCISILHPPVDDPQSGELPSERWNPTQNVRYGVTLDYQRKVWSALKLILAIFHYF